MVYDMRKTRTENLLRSFYSWINKYENKNDDLIIMNGQMLILLLNFNQVIVDYM